MIYYIVGGIGTVLTWYGGLLTGRGEPGTVFQVLGAILVGWTITWLEFGLREARK